jgi:hypothetical protein
MFFSERKNQEPFLRAGAAFQDHHPTGTKSFLLLFFKKEGLSS